MIWAINFWSSASILRIRALAMSKLLVAPFWSPLSAWIAATRANVTGLTES